MSSRLPLLLAVFGGVLLIPAALWLPSSRAHVDAAEAARALQPLLQIPLDNVGDNGLSARIVVPVASQWSGVLKAWGQPDYVISAIAAGRMDTICLLSLPLRVELNDSSSNLVPVQPSHGPYGYSDHCQASSLRFHAAPGNAFQLKVMETRAQALPHADLIVVRDWWNTKDKIVGLDLDTQIGSFVKSSAVMGLLLLLSGLGLLIIRNGVRQRHRKKTTG